MLNFDPAEKRFIRLFALLLAITLFSTEGIWRLAGAEARNVLLAIMLALTLIKVQIVVMNFMELRSAPKIAKIVANCWISGLFLGLITIMEAPL